MMNRNRLLYTIFGVLIALFLNVMFICASLYYKGNQQFCLDIHFISYEVVLCTFYAIVPPYGHGDTNKKHIPSMISLFILYRK